MFEDGVANVEWVVVPGSGTGALRGLRGRGGFTTGHSTSYGVTLDYEFDRDNDPTNAYCRSDHYMYARYGIPVAFFVAAAWYKDYHMVSDEPQYIAYPRMARIGNYVRDVVAAVADLDHRPVVDKPKPDPNGTCRQ